MNTLCCTFFGHRDCPETIREPLRAAILQMIEVFGITRFYLGNQGAFDRIALSLLKEIKTVHSQIEYTVVLAYIPTDRSEEQTETILPDGIEMVPRRFAIVTRNRWMVEHASHVIAYITHSWGGAAQSVDLAEKRGKQVFFIATNQNKR